MRLRPRFVIVAALLAIGSVSQVAASDTLRALARGDVLGVLSLARIGEEVGDGLLAAQLAAQDDRAMTLIAIRASAFSRAPERLIPRLAAHACGRDPALAPEAAYTLRALAERFSPDGLASREVLREDLAKAVSALACVERVPAPRADITRAVATLVAQLEPLTR